MDHTESDLAWSLTDALLDECESATRAAAGALNGLLNALPAPCGRPALHWERTGAGAPVLLIMGLGLSGGAWWRTVPVLARRSGGDHLRQSWRRSTRRRCFMPTAPRRWPTMPCRCSTRPASTARTSTGSRSAAWSRSRWRCGTPSACVRSCSAQRHAGGPHAQPPGRRMSRLPAPAAVDAARRGRLDLGAVQLQRALPRRAPGADRGGHRPAPRPFVPRPGLPGAAVGGDHRTTPIASCTGSRLPTLVVHGSEDLMIPLENGRMLASTHPWRPPDRAARNRAPLRHRGARSRHGDQRLHARAFLRRVPLKRIEFNSAYWYARLVAEGTPLWLKLVLRAERARRYARRVGSPQRYLLRSRHAGEAIEGHASPATVEGVSKRVLHLANLPAGTDIRRVREQLARMERRLVELSKEIDEQAAHRRRDEHR